jgi:hypothetical protein
MCRSSPRRFRLPTISVTAEQSGRPPNEISWLELVDLEREAGEATAHGLVEGSQVLVGCAFIERCGIAVPHLGECLRPELDELLKAAEDLLRLFAISAVVGPLGLVDAGQELGVLLLEEVELAIDQLGEPAGHAP